MRWAAGIVVVAGAAAAVYYWRHRQQQQPAPTLSHSSLTTGQLGRVSLLYLA